MAARKLVTVRFAKEYGNLAGNRFRRYEAPDGRIAEIRIRTGRNGAIEYTNAEAREAATWRLSARPGSVRYVRTWTNDFTGITFHLYESTSGQQESVCITTKGFFGGRRGRRAQTRAEAMHALGGAR